jgi:hypothetical protein
MAYLKELRNLFLKYPSPWTQAETEKLAVEVARILERQKKREAAEKRKQVGEGDKAGTS